MRAPLLLSAALLVWSGVANLVIGERAYVARNLVLVAVLLAVAWRAGLGRDAMGLAVARMSSGLRWGVGAAAVVAAAVSAAVALADVVPGIATLLADARTDALGDGLLYATLVRIPLGTAVFEEVAFRGVLLGWLLRVVTTPRAVVISSAVFGLWHIPPATVTLMINDIAVGSAEGIAAIIGAVVVTTVAGAMFSWLRLRSGSLLAPTLAHWATNSLGLLASAAAA